MLKKHQIDFWNLFKRKFETKNLNYLKIGKPAKRAGIDIRIIDNNEYHIYIVADSKRKILGIKLYIDNNKKIYKCFEKNKKNIESKTGILIWRNIEKNSSSMIIKEKDFNIYDKEAWNENIEYLLIEVPKYIDIFNKY